MSIICGTDFSEFARGAMTTAAALAGRLSEELWLVHALEPQVEEMEPAAREKVLGLLRKRLEAEITAARAWTKSPVHATVVPGKADEVVRGLAREKRASLVVVGSAGHGATALVKLGGTSERLANGNEFPVLVVRDDNAFEAWGRGGNLRVLIGVDESASSASAVRWVERLRAATPVDVVVGRVYYADEAHRRYGLGRRFSFTDPDPAVETLIERDLKKVVPELSGQGEVFYRARLGVGRIADHLLELAEAERCNVVVVGTHARKGIARMWSVSAATLHLARMAVAIVPPDGKEAGALAAAPKLKRVMVTTDFSTFGNAAIPWAYAVVEPGGEVFLTHVTVTGATANELLEQYVPGPQPRGQVESEVAARLRALTPGTADGKGLMTRTEVVRASDAARAIAEAAERLGVDAVVIASHGRSGLARTVMGSTAEAVLRASHRPVFVVRPTVK